MVAKKFPETHGIVSWDVKDRAVAAIPGAAGWRDQPASRRPAVQKVPCREPRLDVLDAAGREVRRHPGQRRQSSPGQATSGYPPASPCPLGPDHRVASRTQRDAGAKEVHQIVPLGIAKKAPDKGGVGGTAASGWSRSNQIASSTGSHCRCAAPEGSRNSPETGHAKSIHAGRRPHFRARRSRGTWRRCRSDSGPRGMP